MLSALTVPSGPPEAPGTAGGHPSSPFVELDRAAWSRLRHRTPLPLTAHELDQLRGLGEVIDLEEVREIYLPLSRLLNIHVTNTHRLQRSLTSFFNAPGAKPRGRREPVGQGGPVTPFVIGVAGSVAVGKSTAARLLRELLARWPEHPRVELVTTDGFLLPNAELERRGIMARKGFPESYDRRALVRFVADVKSGKPVVSAPVYSHLSYDIVPGARVEVHRPDILIVEGLNVLQPAQPGRDGRTRLALSDFFDFSLYMDARTDDIRDWYLNRFRRLRETAFRDPDSYFAKYAKVPEEEAMSFARNIWRDINERNLVDNVLPTRGRASLILRKGPDHAIQGVKMRKV